VTFSSRSSSPALFSFIFKESLIAFSLSRLWQRPDYSGASLSSLASPCPPRYICTSAYLQQESRHLPTPDSLDLSTPPHGVVAPSKTLRYLERILGHVLHWMLTGYKILCPQTRFLIGANAPEYVSICTRHKDLQRIICTGLIPVI